MFLHLTLGRSGAPGEDITYTLKSIERWLNEHQWLCGPAPTVADLSCRSAAGRLFQEAEKDEKKIWGKLTQVSKHDMDTYGG